MELRTGAIRLSGFLPAFPPALGRALRGRRTPSRKAGQDRQSARVATRLSPLKRLTNKVEHLQRLEHLLVRAYPFPGSGVPTDSSTPESTGGSPGRCCCSFRACHRVHAATSQMNSQSSAGQCKFSDSPSIRDLRPRRGRTGSRPGEAFPFLGFPSSRNSSFSPGPDPYLDAFFPEGCRCHGRSDPQCVAIHQQGRLYWTAPEPTQCPRSESVNSPKLS